MFNKKKETKPNKSMNLEQYGIFEVPDIDINNIGNNVIEESDNDEDLEAELAALAADNNTGYKNKGGATRKTTRDINLDEMVAGCVKDINSDEEISEGDDDPVLLKELKMLTGDESIEVEEMKIMETTEEKQIENSKPESVTENNSIQELIKLLQERLIIYEMAEQKAKKENESGKARRYNRGIKVLKEMLICAQSGKNINEADIPPLLSSSATAESTVENTVQEIQISNRTDDSSTILNKDSSESATDITIDKQALDKLRKQQQKYKTAAVAWKRAGNKEQALQYAKTAKQFDIVIAAVTAGEKLDLSDMPSTPILPTPTDNTILATKKEDNEVQQTSTDTSTESIKAKLGVENIEGALKERLEIYRRTKVTAEAENNISKARRYARICKQFEDAIKLYACGKPVDLGDLPVPPGFPPLSSTSQDNDTAVQPTPAPIPESFGNNVPISIPPKIPASPPKTEQKPYPKTTSRAEKQMVLLQQRQRELKQAALNAKKDGDLDLAREYLRQAKGIQPLIEASKGGLPVDMNSIPLSPLEKAELTLSQKDEHFTLISSEDFTEESGNTDDQIYENLEAQLIKQIKWCLSTRDHSKALGDVPGYNRWERLALSYTRDLDMLRVRKRDSLPAPQHHYEMKTYHIVQCCTDLNDGDIEVSIIRGINYSRETDTYVMFEFPFPSDNPPADRTSLIKGSANPEYQATFPLNGIINRSSRQCQRAFKRHALKCQVWAKGGFFRSDSLLGTVTVKLQPLESQCILHDSFPLMDGRKAVGGKLELKIRLRNPISFKQIEKVTDKWLTIDQ